MATYYVKNGGNDALDGLSEANAWETIGKVKTFGLGGNYNPGDFVKFQCGDIWEEDLVVSQSGGLGSPITFTSYGTGARPIITGRDDISGWDTPGNWTQVGVTDVWYMALAPGSGSRPRIWLNEVEVESASSAVLVTNLLPCYQDLIGNNLYVYSPAPATPATHYTRIERSGVRTTAVDIVSKDNITLKELDLRGALYCVRAVIAQNITIEDCNIGMDAGRYGVYINYQAGGPYTESENGLLRRCIIDSGLRFAYSWVYGDPYFCIDGLLIRCAINWDIYENQIIDWNHAGMAIESYTTTAEVILSDTKIHDNLITCPHPSYGHGFGVDIRVDRGTNNKMYRNLIYDVACRNQLNGYGFEFYYNIINTVRGCLPYGAPIGQGLYPSGYTTGGHPQNMKIYNNIIANCADEGIQMYGTDGHFDQTGNEFINNILYNNDSTDDYQIYMSSHATIYTNTFKNNLCYKSGVTDLIFYRGSAMTITEFNAEDGTNGDTIQENITGDPLFVGAADFSLQDNSPAIDAGIDVGLTLDYILNHVPIGAVPDIGAYEWFTIDYDFSQITLVNTPACHNEDDPSIISRWVATECPILFTLLRRDWYVISTFDNGGLVGINILGDFTGNDDDVIALYDETTGAMYTGTITDSSAAPILLTDITYVAGMEFRYMNDHTLYPNYYFEGRLTIEGVLEPLTVTASPDRFGLADLDVSGILRIHTAIGKVTNYLSLIQKDTNKSGNFTLEYRGCWFGSDEDYIQEGIETSPVEANVWYFAEAVRSEEQGCNLAEYVPSDENEAPFLNQFDQPVYWHGLPFDLSFILPEIAEVTPEADITVTIKVYDSTHSQIGVDIVQTITADELEGYVNSLNIDSALIDEGAAYFTVEITTV